jgi:glycosyltransferase involved in cell wall biosynthesis
MDIPDPELWHSNPASRNHWEVKRLKIAIIGPVYPYRGGIAHYTASLAQALAERHEVKVFSFKRQYPAWLYPGRSDKDPDPKAVKVSAAYTIDSLDPLSWQHTANEIRRYRPDLLLIEWWVTFFAPAFTLIAFLCRKSKIPVAFLIHNVLPHDSSFLHRPLAKITLKQGSYFIVHTSRECERLLAIIPNAKVEVCPFPVFVMTKSVTLTKAEARRKLSIPETGHVMLFFGIVRPYKGLIYLFEAMSLLRGKIPGLFLVVAGEFWEDKEFYQKKIDEMGISGQVRLEDRYIPDDEVCMLFKASDLAVMPYVGGTQSAVSALSLGFGTPLLATEWSAAGIDEAYLKLVLIVPSGDAKSLAVAIQSFFENPSSSDSIEDPPTLGGWDTIVTKLEKIVGLSRK